ncbi:MAG TPA: c-type cytochrome [Candidatus Polarisedimenticolia bacterium]|nr:c-type cytochrome [Candidatus Polarisedimenticolia bacterium]
MPLRRMFAATSVLFLIVLAISPTKNYFRPYRALQHRYFRLGAARARSLKAAAEYTARPVAIQQIWLREFEDRVDRCPTCHLGAADELMQDAPEPFRVHPRTAHTPADFDRLGCTSCHGGQGLATSQVEAHGSAPDSGSPMIPPQSIEAGCGRCHSTETVTDAPILSRGRSLMARSGCYACHAVRGHESFRSEAPPLTTIALKTGGGWIKRWLTDPKAVDPNATMPNFQLAERDMEEITHYLFSVPAPPSLAAAIATAAQDPAGDAANGKKLFSESRCISCHTVEGKGNGSAPELSKIASAATRGWLLAFLRDPQAFNPKTRMPRYHFTEVESRDLVAYLEDEFRDFDAPKDLFEPIRVNQTLAENGRRLFRQYGCFSCHSEPGLVEAERFGPDLDGVGDKRAASLDFGRRTDLPRTLPAWLAAKLAAPRSFAPGLKMPSYGFGVEDTAAVVTALLALGAQPVPERYRFAPAGSTVSIPGGPVGALIDRYRCLSCHRIGDRGGDISTAPLTAEGSKVRREWLVDYLVLSYTIRPILEERMPVFRMSRDEATLLADALENFYLDATIPEDPFAGRPPADADSVEGQRLYVTLGCRACHILGTAGGYYGPPLTEAAKRLKPGWVFTWLKGPQRLRADVRCPNYALTDTDALRLTAYLETLRGVSREPAAKGAR